MRHLAILRQIDAVARLGSIRKAAAHLAITPSALNRRVMAFEAELGEKVFERLPRGMRLNPAGELLLHHGRRQIAELERVRSQIADLSGMRRGHVAIACSQALAPRFLPDQIAAYAAQHPAVSFAVTVADHAEAERALADFSVDIALVLGPVERAETQIALSVGQTLMAVMAADHPLAGRSSLRLRQCMDWPLALPPAPFAGRRLLERASARLARPLGPAFESDSFEQLKAIARRGHAITFQFAVGAPAPAEAAETGLVSVPLDSRDAPVGALVAAQLRGRILPVAAARFLDQLLRALAAGDGARAKGEARSG
jgi:DNA-binding transcriptional LysR family regulator